MLEFSKANWNLIVYSLGLVYSVYLCFLSTRQLLRGHRWQCFGFLLATLMAVYMGTRPLNMYGDSQLYSTIFKLVQDGAWVDFKSSGKEWVWDVIEWFFVRHADASSWFLLIDIVYVSAYAVVCWRWMPRRSTTAFMFVATSLSFFSYATNGIRQGMAAALCILALGVLPSDRNRPDWPRLTVCLTLLYLGFSTHTSMQLFAAATIATIIWPSQKIPFYVWMTCLVLSPLSQVFIGMAPQMFEDNRMAHYGQLIAVGVFSRSGWRWDFILYSALPVVLAYWVMFRKKMHDVTYVRLMSVYMYVNATWLLVNSIPYSNRFAYISWCIYPVIVAYPLLKFRLIRHQGLLAGGIMAMFIVLTMIFDF